MNIKTTPSDFRRFLIFGLLNCFFLPLLLAQQDLSVNLRSNQNTYGAYSYITFYVTAKNRSTTGSATNVRVSLPMPANSSFDCSRATSGTWINWTPDGFWTIGNLAASDSAELIVTLFCLDVPNITASASIGSTTSGFSDPVSANNTASKAVTKGAVGIKLPCDGVVAGGDSIDLEVLNTINNPDVNVGAVASFVVQVKNRTSNQATNVQIKDLLPAGLTYSSHNASQGTYNSSTGIWSVGLLQGSSERSMTLNAVVNSAGSITTVAQAFAVNEPDIDSRVNNYSAAVLPREDDEAVLAITGMQVDLSLALRLAPATPTTIRTGQNITYQLILRNSGTTRGEGTKIRAILPPSLQFVSASTTVGVYDLGVGVWLLSTVTDAFGNKQGFTIQPNRNDTLFLTVRPVQTGSIAFNCEVRSCNMPDFDSTPSNMIAGEDDDVTLNIAVSDNNDPTAADLQLSMNAIKTPTFVGDSVVWSVSIINIGPANATGVTVKNDFPAVFSGLSISPSVGTWNATTKIWTIGNLAKDAFHTLTFRGTTACFSAALKNFAQVMAANQTDLDSPHGDDTNQVADQDDESILNYNAINCNTQVADLSLSHTVLKTPIQNGDSLVFAIAVTNSGLQNATGVTVSMNIPTNLSSLVPTPSVANGIWTVGNLANGASRTLTYRGVVTLAQATSVFAQVQAASPADPDSAPGNDTNQTANEDDETLLVLDATSNGAVGCKTYDAGATNDICNLRTWQPYGLYFTVGTQNQYLQPENLDFTQTDSNATLSGTFRDPTWQLVTVNIQLTGRSLSRPSGSPRLGYCLTSSPATGWVYFSNMSGTMSVGGQTLTFARRGAAFQIGVGANLQNTTAFGAGGQFTLSNGNIGEIGLQLTNEQACGVNPCDTDAQPPVISACPQNISRTTPNTCETVSFSAPTATDNCTTNPTVTSNLASGTCFPEGATTVTYTATDARSNTASCSFTVTVVRDLTCVNDVVRPVLSACPANQNLVTRATCLAATWSAPTATDNCTANPTVSGTSSSGFCFPVGSNAVTYTATDAAGNTATCRFTIAVVLDTTQLPACESFEGSNTNDVCNLRSWQPYGMRLTVGTTLQNFHADQITLEVKDTFATLTGTLRDANWQPVALNIRLSGKTLVKPSGSPRLAYCLTSSAATDWLYFTSLSGTINIAGQNLTISRRGAAFQVGVGANLMNTTLLGAGGEFTLSNGNIGEFGIKLGAATACLGTPVVQQSSQTVKPILVAEAKTQELGVDVLFLTNLSAKAEVFVVEKWNASKLDFETLHEIAPKNTTNNTNLQDFYTRDEQASEGENAYRVRALSSKGAVWVSDVVVAKVSKTTPVSVFPNPAQDVLYLKLAAVETKESTVWLYNALGKLMAVKTLAAGNTLAQFDTQDFPAGVYALRLVRAGKRDVVIKAVIQP
jgi:uncharacterized repeat protein (TIGR01451 family)